MSRQFGINKHRNFLYILIKKKYNKKCKWCEKEIEVEKQCLFALHVCNCDSNPNKKHPCYGKDDERNQEKADIDFVLQLHRGLV